MVQTRSQTKKNKEITFSNREFNLLNQNICTKNNEIKKIITNIESKVNNIDTKVNHVVNEVHYIEQLQKNGYSLNQLYLMMILIGIGFIFFHYGKVASYFDEIVNILSTTVSQNYEDFSTYHTYTFNSTFSEDWFDKLVSHPKISEMNLDFYFSIQENNII